MNISISTTELLKVLELTPSEQNIMLCGRHGIGKSQILSNHFESKGMRVVPLFLGQMSDPGDLIGIPYKNEQTGKTEFIPPYWFPTDGKPVVLFLDELNRARPEILQTIMDLALNKTLAGKRLPEGSRIVSAVNIGDQYQLTDLDPALVSRFNIYTFRPTAEEWLLWARKKGLDRRVCDFIQENPAWLDKDPDAKEDEDNGMDKSPDRRGWEKVSQIVAPLSDIDALTAKVISGVVGSKASSLFFENLSKVRLLTGKQILAGFAKHQEVLNSYEIHQISAVNEGIYRHLEVEKVGEEERPLYNDNLDKYFDYLCKSQKEGAAHFANLYISGTYPKAVTYIAKHCPILTMSFQVYISGIK